MCDNGEHKQRDSYHNHAGGCHVGRFGEVAGKMGKNGYCDNVIHLSSATFHSPVFEFCITYVTSRVGYIIYLFGYTLNLLSSQRPL